MGAGCVVQIESKHAEWFIWLQEQCRMQPGKGCSMWRQPNETLGVRLRVGRATWIGFSPRFRDGKELKSFQDGLEGYAAGVRGFTGNLAIWRCVLGRAAADECVFPFA